MAKQKNTTSNPPADLPFIFDFEDMPSMDDLLGDDEGNNFAEGNIVTGKIVARRDDGAMVDIGFKSEGYVPKDEFPSWATVAVGDEIRAVLEELEGDDELPVLSVSKAIFEEAWREFNNRCAEGSTVTGAIKFRVKGGLMVDIGVDAFLPGSQVDITPVRNMDDYVGKEFEFKVLKINKERRNVVVSRRELLEQAKAERRAALLSEIVPGQRRQGVVKNITDFGAFVDLHGIDGLIHITDMSWGRISHPSELVKVGDELECVILDVDRDRERVSLGLKQKFPDPWENVDVQFPVHTVVRGRVVNVMPYGAFVEIIEGVEGLIHVSEMSWTKRITRASDVVKVGDELDAMVLDIQKDAKKISLGLRQTMANPWEEAAMKYPPGTQIKGKVRNMTSYGAFIEIEEDIDGMVHVSDMSWTRKINNPAEVLKKGEEVEAMVLDIDPQQQRISLGIKQLQEDPWEHIDKFYSVGETVRGAVTKLTNFGAFVELEHGIDGLIHISQLSDERVNKVKDVLKVGDDVEAKVIKIDRQERRIGLSMKTVPSADVPMGGSSGGEREPRERYRDDRSSSASNLRPGENMVGFGDIFDSALEEARDQDTPKK